MKRKYIPVEGHSHLYRDDETGAIVNLSDRDYSNYLADKNRKINQESELKQLRSDIDEIKSLLKEFLKG
jgi:hypothetical protein